VAEGLGKFETCTEEGAPEGRPLAPIYRASDGSTLKNDGSSHLALQSARGEARVAATAPAMIKNLASMLNEGYLGINQGTSIEQSGIMAYRQSKEYH
jgi:hypothetical protein